MVEGAAIVRRELGGRSANAGTYDPFPLSHGDGPGFRRDDVDEVQQMPSHLLPTTLVGSYPAARLAHRPRQARAADAAARARQGAVARRSRLAGAGAGRRDDPRDPRPGARRPRHHHRRRDAPRKLLQPLRHRARRRRPRQPRLHAQPQRDADPGAARGRQDPAPASGRGARRQVPARRTPTAPSR